MVMFPRNNGHWTVAGTFNEAWVFINVVIIHNYIVICDFYGEITEECESAMVKLMPGHEVSSGMPKIFKLYADPSPQEFAVSVEEYKSFFRGETPLASVNQTPFWGKRRIGGATPFWGKRRTRI